jgi:hypothetical protein
MRPIDLSLKPSSQEDSGSKGLLTCEMCSKDFRAGQRGKQQFRLCHSCQRKEAYSKRKAQGKTISTQDRKRARERKDAALDMLPIGSYNEVPCGLTGCRGIVRNALRRSKADGRRRIFCSPSCTQKDLRQRRAKAVSVGVAD